MFPPLRPAASVCVGEFEVMNAQVPENRPTSADVAIIGAGPAGLTAAYLLTQQGYKVTVIEKIGRAHV